MSLINTNVIDLSSNAVTFTSYEGATLIESISFNGSSNQITFNIITGNTISGIDFITLLQQIVIYQTAINYNFSPGGAFITPFNSFVSNEHYISFTNFWTLTCNESSGPTIVQYSAASGTGQVSISARSAPITIPFSEWVMLLQSLAHYQQSVKNFLGL